MKAHEKYHDMTHMKKLYKHGLFVRLICGFESRSTAMVMSGHCISFVLNVKFNLSFDNQNILDLES